MEPISVALLFVLGTSKWVAREFAAAVHAFKKELARLADEE